jgi:ERCC4-type nuclease
MIIVDVHEPNHLKALADEVREIPVDFIVVGSERKYMVERKEVIDLWKSVQDGRLWRQLKYMEDARSEGYVPILLVEGSLGKLFRFAETMTPRKFMGLQLAFSSFGVSVVQLSPKMVKSFVKFLNEKADKKRRFERPNIPKPIERSLDEERVDVLRAIRGIGEKTADELLRRFVTVANVVNAPEEDLQEILGKKAAHFIEVVRGTYNGGT